MYQQTFLRENDNVGIVSSTFNSPCVDANGNPQPGFTDPVAVRRRAGSSPTIHRLEAPSIPSLLPYDLTRGGALVSPTSATPM